LRYLIAFVVSSISWTMPAIKPTHCDRVHDDGMLSLFQRDRPWDDGTYAERRADVRHGRRNPKKLSKHERHGCCDRKGAQKSENVENTSRTWSCGEEDGE
jgi:hypothetical protein